MKKFSELSILSVVVFLFLLSCSKSGTSSTNNIVTFSFNANGTNYDWVSTYLHQYAFIHFNATDSIPEVQLNAGDSTSISIDDTLSLFFIIAVKSLSQKTYTLDSIISSQVNVPYLKNGATRDSPTSPPSWVTLTFTNIHDNLYDGTFSAFFASTTPIAYITNGVFKNVPVK